MTESCFWNAPREALRWQKDAQHSHYIPHFACGTLSIQRGFARDKLTDVHYLVMGGMFGNTVGRADFETNRRMKVLIPR